MIIEDDTISLQSTGEPEADMKREARTGTSETEINFGLRKDKMKDCEGVGDTSAIQTHQLT